MTMTRRLYSISAIATELGKDRRTVARELEGLRPAESKTIGDRVEQRWYLSDVLAHLQKPQPSAKQDARIRDMEAELMEVTKQWVGHTMYPQLVTNDRFARRLLIYAHQEFKATKEQAYELLAHTRQFILTALCEGFKDEAMTFQLSDDDPMLEWGDAKRSGKVAEFIARHWPDKKPAAKHAAPVKRLGVR